MRGADRLGQAGPAGEAVRWWFGLSRPCRHGDGDRPVAARRDERIFNRQGGSMPETVDILIQFMLAPSLVTLLDERARQNDRTRSGELRAIVKAALGVTADNQPEA